MGDASYFPIAVQIGLAIFTALTIIVISHLFGQRMSGNRIKDSAYECGMVPFAGGDGARFSIKFYTVAMLFILFDIEVVFLIPWAMIYRDFLSAGIPILTPILFFMMVLVVGLVYELKKGAIEWDR
jgi:NADH-quinone oxidoreductase subunit A